MSPVRVVVVGGGIGGLLTAAQVARGGAQVTLLERHDQLGGRAGRLQVDGFTFDTGPSWYFMPEVIEHAFALLGRQVPLDLVELDPVYRLFAEPPPGRRSDPFDLVADPQARAAAFDAIEPGAGAAIARYTEQAGLAYRMALDHFLYTTFADLGRLAAPDLLGHLGELAGLLRHTLAERIATTVQHPVLRQVLGYHAVFLGSSPYRVPALYSLMSHLDLGQGVRYPRGGMYRLVEALVQAARAEGVQVRTGANVSGIVVQPVGRSARRPRQRGRAVGVRLADGELVPAEIVVAGTDRHHTETVLLDPRYAELPEPYWQRHGPGISALLVMAGVRGPLPELAHHSLFFTADWPANFEAILGEGASTPAGRLRVPQVGSLYVSRPSATDPDLAPPGHETLFVLVPFPADPGIGVDRTEVETQADRYLDQIGAWAGIDGLRSRVVTRRVVAPADLAAELSAWRGTALGMEHTLRQSAMLRPGGASARVPNLLHVGAGTAPGVGIPMVAISAELAVKRLLGERSTHPLPTPLRPGFLGSALPGGLWSEVAW
jgi:phytoene desaturase